MVFSETIESITKLNEMLTNENIKSEVIHNKIKSSQRKDILDKWGTTFHVLLSVHTLEIGFDIPSVSIGIIVSNSQNINQLVQRIGRVIRKSAGKAHALIYVVYVEGTKDRKILKLIESSLNERTSTDNKQKKISAFF
jgi:superfamily II DNA or RNA helicase